MNIEDLLRADADRNTGNPLEPHLGGLVQRVRRRRRRRAGAQVAGVVTAVAAGLVVWQVGGPWDRPVPPPATDPPDEQWCGQPLEEVAGSVAHPDLGVAELESTDEQLTVSVTISSETDLELSPLVDVLFTDPDTGEVVGYSEDDREADREDANLFVPAGGEADTGRSVSVTWCTAAFTGPAEAYAGDFRADDLSWLTEPAAVEVTDGAIGPVEDTPDQDATDGQESTDPEDDADGQESTDPEGEDHEESPDGDGQLSAPEAYEPTCGQPWQPPSAETGWQVSADFGDGPFRASPDGATGGLSTDVTLANTSDEELTADTYTQVVLVQDGAIVSPELLGSDDVRETTLAPGEETTQTAGHHIWDYCDESWTGVGPSVPAGEYTAYVLVLDAGPYWANGERAVLAVSDGQTIEVSE